MIEYTPLRILPGNLTVRLWSTEIIKSWRFWVGLLISAVCLYFAFQGIRLDQVADALREINPIWLVPAFLAFAISYAGRVFRWQLLFAPQRVRIWNVFHSLNIGYFLSNILPARLGDIIRAYLIGELEGVSKARALSTVVVERLSDGLNVVLLLAITAPFVNTIPSEATPAAMGVGLAGVAGIAILLMLTFQKERGMALLRRLTAPIPFLRNEKLWGALEALIDGFAVLRSPRALLGVESWSLEAWILGGMMFWFVMLAMGLNLPIPAAFLVMTITSLAVVIPSSPGYIGVFEAATTVVLVTAFGVDQTHALSYALVMHAFNYLWLIVLGVYSIWHEGLSYASLTSLQASAPDEASTPERDPSLPAVNRGAGRSG